MNLSFKRAALADWETVLFLEKSASSKLFYAFTNEKDVKEYLSKSEVYIVYKSKTPIGTVSFEIKGKDHAYFDALTILPKFRNKGYATMALKWIFKKLDKYKTIDLLTHPHNMAAIKVYLKFGFVIDSWKENSFGDGEPRIRLVRERG